MYVVESVFKKSIAICLIAWACAALAEYNAENDGPYDYYSTHSLFLRPWFAQFESWYPHNAKYLVEISTGICNQTLRDYRIGFAAPRNSVNATKLLSICYRHEACIVNQLQTNHLLNYQSALVTLGLVPTLLVFVGPSVAEVSLLYLHRPILSALLSLGTPTIWTGSNLFEANTPDRARGTTMDALVPRRVGPRVAAALSAGEYLLAAGAATNSILTALETGQKTILTWGCTTQFLPLIWAVFPSLVYAVAGAKSYYFATAEEKKTEETMRRTVSRDENSTNIALTSRNQRGIFNAMLRRLRSEATVCANRENFQNIERLLRLRKRRRRRNGSRSKAKTKMQTFMIVVAQLFDLVIAIVGVVHFAFGIAVFSSLQFVTVLDACGRILCRFALSSLICRVIVVVELAGLDGGGLDGGDGGDGDEEDEIGLN